MATKALAKRTANKTMPEVNLARISFRSGTERRMAEWLEAQRQDGLIDGWNYQPPAVKLAGPNGKVVRWAVNFEVFKAGQVMFMDLYGVRNPGWPIKRSLWQEQRPAALSIVAETKHGFKVVEQI